MKIETVPIPAAPPLPVHRTQAPAAPNELSEILQSNSYVRERYLPEPSDGLYLHLSDLRLALEPFRTDEDIVVLDFGCGGSPYRALFPNATYMRADVAGEDLDYTIREDGRSDAPAECCDLLLSTQVLEHVSDVTGYLNECFRVLKPGGRMICSTHGTFDDHPCPDDWNRWTAAGFRRDLQRAGFVVNDVLKLTTGPRAILFLLDLHYPNFRGTTLNAFKVGAKIFRYCYDRWKTALHRVADRHLSRYRVVSAPDEKDALYICVLAECRKPANGRFFPVKP